MLASLWSLYAEATRNEAVPSREESVIYQRTVDSYFPDLDTDYRFAVYFGKRDRDSLIKYRRCLTRLFISLAGSYHECLHLSKR